MAAAAFLALVLQAHQPALTPAHYRAAHPPLASLDLVVDASNIRVVDARNVGVSLRNSEYSDLDITHAFHIACTLPPNDGLWRVRAFADYRYNLIPATIVEYKYYNPTYVELEIDPSTFTDTIDADMSHPHRVHIEFYTRNY
jgi:hypothetical protein